MMSRFVPLALLAFLFTLLGSGCSQAAPAPAPTKAAAPAAATEPTKAAPSVQPTAAPAPKVDFPAKGRAISIVVPWAAGGSNDLLARLVAPVLEKELGTSVQVVNKAGAGSQVGLAELAASKPDGYNIGVNVLPATIAIYLDPERKATFGPKNFQTLAVAANDITATVVRADSPFKTMKDLVDAAKANPEKVKIGDSGVSSSSNMTTLALQKATGAKLAIVHMDGDPQQITAILGGHIDVGQSGAAGALATYKSKDIRVIGTSAREQSQFFPDAKPMASQGYDVVLPISRGFVMPTGAPKEIVDILSAAFKKSLNSSEFKTKALEIGLEPNYLDPDQYATQWTEIEKQVGPLMDDIKAAQKTN